MTNDERLKGMVSDLCDALIEEFSPSERRCLGCDFVWRRDQAATDKVHGEGCVVLDAQNLLKELGA
jgi:hypothetical protein